MGEAPVKKVADLLEAFLDKNLSTKAERVSGFFRSWRRIAGDRLSAHSDVVEVDRGIAMVEADHPSWIQLLQMRQEELLRSIRSDFPQLEIRGLAFRLRGSRPAAPSAMPGELDRLPDPEDKAGLQALVQARLKMEELRQREEGRDAEADAGLTRQKSPEEGAPAGDSLPKGLPEGQKSALDALLSDFRRIVEERNAEG